jgi:hypothetical protein
VQKLRAEDAIAEALGDKSLRVGIPMKVDVDAGRKGLWERLPEGDRLWRVRVRSRGALWLVLGFGTFRPAAGMELWVYSEDGETLLGGFSDEDERWDGQLWMPPIEGESLVVELRWPEALADAQPNVHLGVVSHGYRPFGRIGKHHTGNDGDSGSCNNDVNCPEGAAWGAQKRSVVNLLTSSGSQYCTGSLITTTDGDCRNLVLTANHCADSQTDAASTTFQFNYERPGCSSGDAPTDHQITGADLRATYSGSDFTLFEMTGEPLEEWDAHYNGWSRSTTPASESTCVHHPRGDVKKISFNYDPLVDGVNYGPDHWRVTEWEDGTTEGGSSGSPLYDQDKRTVGQLHGGTASCTSITWDEYGKLDVSWDGGGASSSRLSDWLDPSGSGAVTADGVDWTSCQVPKPSLVVDSWVLDDSSGNGDGVLDPGETVRLEVLERNQGTLDATNVSGTISTATPLVTIDDAQADWPTIPQAEVRSSLDPHFSISVDSGFACGEVVNLSLDVLATESPGQWSQQIQLRSGSPVLATEFSDDMESGAGSWITAEPEGANPWQLTTADSRSATTSWFVADNEERSDSVLEMPQIVNLPANSELRFWHRFNTEASWDGGVIEYTTDGSTWVDAGPLVITGPYSGAISGSALSNLAGRSAWTGDSGGWQQVSADLSSLAGESFGLRWRFASDDSVGDEGWYVDDVVVESTSYVCGTPLAKPGEAAHAGGFTIEKDPGGFLLTWTVPTSGGPVDVYKLYRTDLTAGAPMQPVCEADLGSGLSATLSTLTSDHGFLVVARNASGDGGLGSDSSGVARPEPAAESACP